MENFLVVYEDVWRIKESYKTDDVVSTIKMIMSTYDVEPSNDLYLDNLDGKDPFSAGTFGNVLCDIDMREVREVKTSEDDDDEYAGRIMMFYIGE